MTKPSLVKVRALFYVLQHVTKKEAAPIFDTASSSDGISVPMVFRNLSGRNFSGKEYRNYLRHVAYDDMGFVPGTITLWRGGRLVAEAKLGKID